MPSFPPIPAAFIPEKPTPLPAPHKPSGVTITVNCRNFVFERALRAEAKYQFDAQADGLFANLPQKGDPITFTIDLPLKDAANAGRQFADYLDGGLPASVCATLLRDRLEGASVWLTRGLSDFAFAAPGRKLELDAECRRRLGEGKALPLSDLLTKAPAEGGEAQSYSLVAFLAQRRTGMTGVPGWDNKSYFVRKLSTTDKLARQGGANPAAWEWGFQDMNEMQAAWIAWLKQPESRPDWMPPPPTIPMALPAAERTPKHIPPTDVGGKPVDDRRIPLPVRPNDKNSFFGPGMSWNPGI